MLSRVVDSMRDFFIYSLQSVLLYTIGMFGRWSRNQDRRIEREKRRKKRRAFFASLVRKFTESIAYALVAKYGWLILLVVLAIGGVAITAFLGGN